MWAVWDRPPTVSLSPFPSNPPPPPNPYPYTQVKSPDPCGGTVPSASALVLTLLLKNYDPSSAEGRKWLGMAKAWEKGVFLREAERAQVCVCNGGLWWVIDQSIQHKNKFNHTYPLAHIQFNTIGAAGQRRAGPDARHVPVGALGGGLAQRAFVC